MESFAEILKQFTHKQRLIVLMLLLVFMSLTYISVQYLKVDDCRGIINENLALQNDLVTISKLIRASRMQEPIVEAVSPDMINDSTVIIKHIPVLDINDKILSIAERNIKPKQ